jgi:hypothetical protein
MSNVADKARAAGCDEWTVRVAYLDFANSPEYSAAQILEAHRRVCIYAMCHDNPTGNARFPLFGAGIVRHS